jgi:outer membrane lipoprotein SlyB
MGYQMKRGAAPKFRELGSSNPQPGDSPNKNALQGAAQGAKLGATLGTVVPGLGNVAGGIIGGIGGLIMGGIKAKKEKIAMMDEEKKNELLAKTLQKAEDEEKNNPIGKVGYSGFDAAEFGTN